MPVKQCITNKYVSNGIHRFKFAFSQSVFACLEGGLLLGFLTNHQSCRLSTSPSTPNDLRTYMFLSWKERDDILPCGWREGIRQRKGFPPQLALISIALDFVWHSIVVIFLLCENDQVFRQQCTLIVEILNSIL